MSYSKPFISIASFKSLVFSAAILASFSFNYLYATTIDGFDSPKAPKASETTTAHPNEPGYKALVSLAGKALYSSTEDTASQKSKFIDILNILYGSRGVGAPASPTQRPVMEAIVRSVAWYFHNKSLPTTLTSTDPRVLAHISAVQTIMDSTVAASGYNKERAEEDRSMIWGAWYDAEPAQASDSDMLGQMVTKNYVSPKYQPQISKCLLEIPASDRESVRRNTERLIGDVQDLDIVNIINLIRKVAKIAPANRKPLVDFVTERLFQDSDVVTAAARIEGVGYALSLTGENYLPFVELGKEFIKPKISLARRLAIFRLIAAMRDSSDVLQAREFARKLIRANMTEEDQLTIIATISEIKDEKRSPIIEDTKLLSGEVLNGEDLANIIRNLATFEDEVERTSVAHLTAQLITSNMPEEGRTILFNEIYNIPADEREARVEHTRQNIDSLLNEDPAQFMQNLLESLLSPN